MYDNQTAGAAQARPPQPVPTRPLDGISAAADRAYRIGNVLEAFLNRVHGPGPDAAETAVPMSIGYSSELSRLHGNLDRIDRLNESLEAFG